MHGPFVGPHHLSPSLCPFLGSHVSRQVKRKWDSVEKPPEKVGPIIGVTKVVSETQGLAA